MELLQILSELQWRQPLFFLLPFIPLIFYAIQRHLQWQNQSNYADRKLIPWVVLKEDEKDIGKYFFSRIFSKTGLYLIAWIFLSIALAGPRMALQYDPSSRSPKMNIVFVVDSSRSMSATDVHPNRLQRIRIEIEEFLSIESRFSLGMVIYAARPHLYIPITHDLSVFNYYLKMLGALKLPTEGTSLLAALKLAEEILNQNVQPDIPSAIVLLSDGDIQLWSDLKIQKIKNLAKAISEKNISLLILGVGTTEGGAILNQDGEWLKYNGRPLISRTNFPFLQQLGSANNAAFSMIQDDKSDWIKIYTEGLSQYINLDEYTDQQNVILWNEYYYWALIPGMFCLCIAIIPLNTSILRKKLLSFSVSVFYLGVGVFLFAIPIADSQAESLLKKAYLSYKNENYQQALTIYKDISGYNGRMGEGQCYYLMHDYPSAIAQFSHAVIFANNDTQRSEALFGLANSYFRKADYGIAIKVYADVLLYDTHYQAVHYNLKYAINLQQRIINRMRKDGLVDRMGSGLRQQRINENIDIIEKTTLSMDSVEKKLVQNQPMLNLDEQSLTKIRQLVATKLDQIHLAVGQSNIQHRPARLSNKIDVKRLELTLKHIDDRPEILWKRVFEMEENFPASLDETKTIPGVLPW